MTTMPDFDAWAESLVDKHCQEWQYHLYLDIEQALKQSFDQGRALGYREGFDEG